MVKEYPLVSIVIPSFNKTDLLIDMIRSIVGQTYDSWELLIVDDGSCDECFDKVHEFTSMDRRITHIRRNREPKNGDTCRNIGLEMAKGEYLLFFDADDIITPTCIENRVAFMQANPECDYASFPYALFFDEKGSSFYNLQKVLNVVAEEEFLSYILQANYPFTVWSNIYRRESLKDIRWDERVFVYQDFDFMVSCVQAGLKHKYCNHVPDYYYRQFSDGSNVCGEFVSHQKSESTIYLFSKILAMLKGRVDYEKRMQDFLKFIELHFRRLILGRSFDDAKHYLEMLRCYYPQAVMDPFERMLLRFLKTKYNRAYALKVYWSFYRQWHNAFNRTMAFHSLGKLFLSNR